MLLSNHGQALVAIAENPDARLREIAERVGITERATQSIVNDLVEVGYVIRTRVGRRNSYTVDPSQPFQHPALAQGQIGSLLSGLVPWKQADEQTAAPASRGEKRPQATPTVDQLARDENLDRLTALASELLRVPICFLSIIAGQVQVIKSGVGVPDERMRHELPIDQSICQHVVSACAPLVITDTAEHPLAQHNPVIAQLGLRSYAGLPVITADGTVIGSFCAVDVQPRRWTEAEVGMLTILAAAAGAQTDASVATRGHREAAHRYRVLLDSLPETLILVCDKHLRLQVASGDNLRRLGTEPELLIGRTLDEIIPPEQAAILRPHFQAGFRGELHEFQYTGIQGHRYSVQILPLRDPDGEIRSVMSIGREHLTFGRRDHWDAERLRTLIENIPGAIYRCGANSDWQMAFISEQIERVTGYPASDFIDSSVRSYASVIHPNDRAMVEREVLEAVAEHRPFIIEYRINASDGTVRWVRERGQGSIGDDGQLLFLDGAIFAIDEHARRLAA